MKGRTIQESLVAGTFCYNPLASAREFPCGFLSAIAVQLAPENGQTVLSASFGGYGLLDGPTAYTDVVTSLGRTFLELFNLNIIPSHDIMELKQLIIMCEDSPLSGANEYETP